MPGRHNIENALAALAAASVWGVGADEAAAVFPQLLPGEMRGRLLRFEAGFAVINDSYNSNPVALGAMIELLAQHAGLPAPHSGRRRNARAGTAIRAVASRGRPPGRRAKRLDWILGVQGEASKIVGGAVEAGLPAARARFFANSADAAAFLGEMVQPGDLLLVKGSRGVKMERIVEALREQLRAGWRSGRRTGRAARGAAEWFTTSSITCRRPVAHLLNVFRYITVRTALASLSALFLGLVARPLDDPAPAPVADQAIHPRGRPDAATRPRPARPPWAAF